MASTGDGTDESALSCPDTVLDRACFPHERECVEQVFAALPHVSVPRQYHLVFPSPGLSEKFTVSATHPISRHSELPSDIDLSSPLLGLIKVSGILSQVPALDKPRLVCSLPIDWDPEVPLP